MTPASATPPADPTRLEWQADIRDLVGLIVDFSLPAPHGLGLSSLSPLEVFPHGQPDTRAWLRNLDYPIAAENSEGRVTILGRYGHLWLRVWLPLDAIVPAPRQPSGIAAWVRAELGALVWS